MSLCLYLNCYPMPFPCFLLLLQGQSLPTRLTWQPCHVSAHVKGTLQDLADTVGLFPRTALCVLAHFTRQCVPLCVVVDTEKEAAGCCWGWVSHLDFCQLVSKFHIILLCSVLWDFVNEDGDDGAYQLHWEQKKAQEGFGHTQTKWDHFFSAFGAFRIDEDVAEILNNPDKEFMHPFDPIRFCSLRCSAHVCSLILS